MKDVKSEPACHFSLLVLTCIPLPKKEKKRQRARTRQKEDEGYLSTGIRDPARHIRSAVALAVELAGKFVDVDYLSRSAMVKDLHGQSLVVPALHQSQDVSG